MQRRRQLRQRRRVTQGRDKLAQFRACGAQLRRNGQRTPKPGALDQAELAVQFGLQPFHLAWISHAVVTPRLQSFSRSAWRALYSRDFTVFSGMWRISAICP